MSQNQVQTRNYDYQYELQGYHVDNPIPYTSVIEGYFPKENSRKEMAIRRINTTLTCLLVGLILFTAISYYFATVNEMELNNLNRQTVVLNDENADLQNKLDRLKSFNNVDMTMQKNNILKKAQQVMEIPAISSSTVADRRINAQKPFSWAIGY